MNKGSFAIHTLGCKVNQAESADIAQMLKEAGYQQVDFTGNADIYIINTCTVTAFADGKSRQFIRRAVKQNPQAIVVATGCFVQTHPHDLQKIVGVDIIAGLSERAKLLDFIEKAKVKKAQETVFAVGDISQCKEFVDIPSTGHLQDRSRAFLKIEDGCENYCSYCIIPYARGPVRSMKIQDVLQKAQELLNQGMRELVLSGIHLGAYGRDFGQNINLNTVVQKLLLLDDLKRLRLGSIEPDEITDSLLETIKNNQVLCPHLHLPLQSGCDKTLKAMQRKYDTDFFATLMQKIKKEIPHIAITTDIMVGFPGETEEDFLTSLQFIKEQQFAQIHVFPYSIRPGTPAATMPQQIAQEEKARRVKQMEAIGKDSQVAYWRQNVGQVLTICLEQEIERYGQRYWFGHSENYLPVMVKADSCQRGDLLPVHIDGIQDNLLHGHSL